MDKKTYNLNIGLQRQMSDTAEATKNNNKNNEATLIPALNIVTAVVVRIKALVEGFQARTLKKRKESFLNDI